MKPKSWTIQQNRQKHTHKPCKHNGKRDTTTTKTNNNKQTTTKKHNNNTYMYIYITTRNNTSYAKQNKHKQNKP